MENNISITYEVIASNDACDTNAIACFLEEHLEQYGDRVEDIEKAINFIFHGNGGVLVIQRVDDQIVGATVINKTGMHGYIPENILVYIAIHKDFRGKGLGRGLMMKALDHVEGDVALHVERDNPAIKLYESIGFTNPYLEMRLKRT